MTMPSPIDRQRADRGVIEAAAAALRSSAIQDAYAGRERKDVAFALCLVLDELGRHWGDLDDDFGRQVVQACQVLLGEPAVSSGTRRTRKQ
jgi:hypothetical protein